MNNFFNEQGEKRVLFNINIEWLLVYICFLKEEHNVIYKSNVWFLLQGAYCVIFLPDKKCDPKPTILMSTFPRVLFSRYYVFWNSLSFTSRLCCQCQDNKTCALFVGLLWATQIQSLRFNIEGWSSEVVFNVPVATQYSRHVDKYIICKGTLWQQDVHLLQNLYQISISYSSCMIVIQMLQDIVQWNLFHLFAILEGFFSQKVCLEEWFFL